MLILGIETSCDDTGVAIVEAPNKKGAFKILSNIVSSQIKTHAPFGGVVPNLAAREHLKNIEPCLKTALNEANVKMKNIDLIAVTIGPGLIPSLLIGVNFAKALAYKFQIPIVPVNHIEGHIVSALLGGDFNFETRISNFESNSNFKNSKIESKLKIQNSKFFPAIALVVSGGHTQLVLMKDFGKYKIIGETRDDAAGECFDKVAKLLELGYPGGPVIAAQATKFQISKSKFQIKSKIPNFKLPRPMIKHKNYDFSFSGLKTAVLYLVKDNKNKLKDEKFIQEICHETQQAIIDVLISKTLRAAKECRAKTIILAGGVAANTELREQFEFEIRNSKFEIKDFLVPPKNLCTDNGAMIAMAGYFGAKRHPAPRDNSWKRIKANANLRTG
ncbi:MAG: tRNA (adenosine(37)-N6)-threonylcarbamoyltransferase complex transferase subunit TsaD [Candidatus Portnoybacteria bacterium RBG_13_40_8]|uniref:tRNA N6-adenosine threonylcarbamoyltransferase n=1 Tax=Candidatus Portnoybacteria bacterium RBG_13_40_8 TaxID=1801990 RepID=A0A1G2F4S2_9BACT|nr:MAG: tRNA (adenosine(37)-N6)-threonylcarbamoyltransferase complex transferase subunit TsaD [Candidatus Portnoybacteria bacterium RBG_13_40_8]OGZ36091.1 MAG: tRNA (adenosine(37)-N6)-threonylcarbamoyltransferase complex transferase subunit TsaD [Candidatus Portnoybacteria bacterium RIFCSPHIGHO2_01_FULL_39_19]